MFQSLFCFRYSNCDIWPLYKFWTIVKMFWKYNSLAVSQIDSLLEKQDVTLAEILQQEDIIQECKSQNKKLVELLVFFFVFIILCHLSIQ